VFDAMGDLIADYAYLWAIPIGVCAFGLVIAVVVNGIRTK